MPPVNVTSLSGTAGHSEMGYRDDCPWCGGFMRHWAGEVQGGAQCESCGGLWDTPPRSADPCDQLPAVRVVQFSLGLLGVGAGAWLGIRYAANPFVGTLITAGLGYYVGMILAWLVGVSVRARVARIPIGDGVSHCTVSSKIND